MSKHPEVLWAQRSHKSSPEKNIVYLTVNLPDIVEKTLEYKLTPTGLSFKTCAGSGEQTDYAFDLELFGEVDPENSTRRITSRSLVAILRKKELKTEYWPRLTKEKLKTPFIKTDFSKWADEDDQDGNPNPNELDDEMSGIPGMGDNMAGMDFSKFMKDSPEFNLGGDSALGANDPAESDEDEDGPPALEEVEPSK